MLPDDRTKEKGKNLILIYETEQDMLVGDYDEALDKSLMINDLDERNDIQDRIYLILIEKLLKRGISKRMNHFQTRSITITKKLKY